MDMHTEALLFIGTLLTVTGLVLAGFAYIMLKRESASKRLEATLESVLTAHAIADQARPWNGPGADFKPVNRGAYEVRPAWYKGKAFLAWWSGSQWVDFDTREHLLAQSYEWRKLVRVSTLA